MPPMAPNTMAKTAIFFLEKSANLSNMYCLFFDDGPMFGIFIGTSLLLVWIASWLLFCLGRFNTVPKIFFRVFRNNIFVSTHENYMVYLCR